MIPSTVTQIKLERLVLAIAATFLIADNVPHPNLGPSLATSTLEHLQHFFQPSQLQAPQEEASL